MVKVICAMSAASSRDNPYLKGMEYTRRSYLFNNICHAPVLPCRQRWIRSRSESTASCSLFTNTSYGQAPWVLVGYYPSIECERGLSGTLCLSRLSIMTPLADAEL